MATIDDERAKMLAGQAWCLKEDARKAGELLRCGRIEEAAELMANTFRYGQAIWCELDYLTRPPREIPMRGKSRRR